MCGRGKFYTGLVVLISASAALLLSELIIRTLTHYPDLGMKQAYHIYPNDAYYGGISFEKIYRPYASYYDVENGYRVYKKNNIGLPGLDVDLNEKDIIVVMGNSFIESRSTPPESIASSVFRQNINKTNRKYQVVNLAAGGQTPLLGLYRLQFWQKKLHPKYVIFILEGAMAGNIAKYENKEFQPDVNFGIPVDDLKNTVAIRICSASAYANLVRNGIKFSHSNSPENNENTATQATTEINLETYEKIMHVLKLYQRIYGKGFMVYSLCNDQWNNRLKTGLAAEGIYFDSNSSFIHVKNYRIDGTKHFAPAGDKALGQELADFFTQYLIDTNNPGAGGKLVH